jgi:hypothetical protein
LNYYIYTKSRKEFVDKVLKLEETKVTKIELVEINTIDELILNSEDHLLVTGDVSDIKRVMNFAYVKEVSLGIIPTSEQKSYEPLLNYPLN